MYTCQVAVWGAKTWSASMVCLLSQDFYWNMHMGDYVCRNVAWLHLVQVESICLYPPPLN